MRTTLIKTIFGVLTVLSLAAPIAAQEKPSARMFVGETLTYEGKIKKFLKALSIAELRFAVTSAPDLNELLIKSEAESKGTLLKLFRYSFLQKYDSTLDLARFRTLTTVKHD